MINGWLASLSEANIISIVLLLVVVISLLQGWSRGFSSATGRLFGLLGTGLFTIASLVLAIPAAAYLTPLVQTWAAGVKIPDTQLTQWQQIYYTAVSVMAESPVVRFLLLLLVAYLFIRMLLGLLSMLLPFPRRRSARLFKDKKITQISRMGGALVGLIIGLTRGLIIVLALFICVGLNPESGFSRYVESSPIYSQSAAAVFEPFVGETVQQKLPILTKTVAAEMNDILRRKYEVIDHEISQDIVGAAEDIAGQAKDEEKKAKLLYDWVGTRIAYDYEKADNYIQKRIWHEQTPQDTFDTRLGVCIDYARLYAVMARSQGLQVRVVTGQGYDGRGGYGAHAWNEVYINERQAWIPLDPTWASSGDWFNPKDFDETHIRENAL